MLSEVSKILKRLLIHVLIIAWFQKYIFFPSKHVAALDNKNILQGHSIQTVVAMGSTPEPSAICVSYKKPKQSITCSAAARTR